MIFCIEREDLVWRLEEDTPDKVGELNNVEVKTSPTRGFGYEEIQEIGAEMERVLTSLYQESQRRWRRLNVDRKFLNRILNNKYEIRVPCSKCCLCSFSKFSVSANKNESRVRPQITYQLPLEEIPRVFNRLKDIHHMSIKAFISALMPVRARAVIADNSAATLEMKSGAGEDEAEVKASHPHPDHRDAGFIESEIPSISRDGEEKPTEERKKTSTKRVERIFPTAAFNKKKDRIMLKFFSDIAPDFRIMEEGPAKGLTMLFLYYWYELFNGKKIVPPREVGLKKYLGIMSRVPFSQLYDHMQAADKLVFRNFIERYLEFARGCNLRDYKGYTRAVPDPDPDSDADPENLSVNDWFMSIINPATRRRGVDLLSPPSDLDGHSMGALDMAENANGFALIEVRGYSSIKYNGEDLRLNQISDLINREANWFFHRGE